jgi:hypothetical protein
LLGSNVNGSSLPNRSGMPNCLNLAVRALCRWQASCIICGVAEVGLLEMVGVVDAVVDVVVVVCADADAPTKAAAATAIISFRGVLACFMASS